MTKIVITDLVYTEDDFVELEMLHNVFWRVFHILKNLFQTELSTDELNRFTGCTQAIDVQYLDDIPAPAFRKAVAVLEKENEADFAELLAKMKQDPRFSP